jgi:hypothetical protein
MKLKACKRSKEYVEMVFSHANVGILFSIDFNPLLMHITLFRKSKL